MRPIKQATIFWSILALFALASAGGVYWLIGTLSDAGPAGLENLPLQQEEQIPFDLLSDVQEEYTLTIASRLSDGEIYQPAQAICIMVEKYADDMSCRFRQSGEQQGRLELISEALLIDQVNQYGLYGESEGKQKQIITSLYTLAFQCVVRKSSGIRSLSELTNKRVAVGSLYSEEEMLTRKVLEAHNVDYQSFEPVYIGLPEATKAMEAGLIDCIAVHGALPSQAIAQMAANFDIALLPLEDATVIDELGALLPGYRVITVPAQTYKGMDRYLLTAATKVMLASERETKLVVTYEVTKALYEHMTEYKSIFFIDQELKGNQLNDKYPISFHQGAVKYYWERGFIWN